MRSGVIKSIIKFFGVYWIWSPSPSVIWSSLDAQRMNLYSLNQSIQLLVSINTLKSVLFANCCSNWSIFYDNRNESQSEGKVVPCITYNVWDTRSLTFRHKILHMICGFRHDRYTTSSVYSEFLQNLADFTSYWIKIRRNSESL